MNKKYSNGLYGGKFMPMSLAHYHCLSVAAQECDTVYCILFYNGPEEQEIKKYNYEQYLSLTNRAEQLYRVCSYYKNVKPIILDIHSCHNKDGSANLDLETPLVLQACGVGIEAIYGTNRNYKEYYERAYPYAVYRLIDPDHKYLNISSTELRNMPITERKEWII